MRNAVYGENVQSICRVCGAADEAVAHIVSECAYCFKTSAEGAQEHKYKYCYWQEK